MTKKHRGGFTAILVIIIAIALMGASGYLAAEMMKNNCGHLAPIAEALFKMPIGAFHALLK